MISTCRPAGTRTPVISVSRTTVGRGRRGPGTRTERSSLIAFGIRSGSRHQQVHCSGWVANECQRRGHRADRGCPARVRAGPPAGPGIRAAFDGPLVGGGQQVISHAAGDSTAVPNHPAGKPEHLDAPGSRPPSGVAGPQNVESRTGPFDQVLRALGRPADQFGYHRHRQRGREVNAVDLTPAKRRVDHLHRTTPPHLVVDRARHPWKASGGPRVCGGVRAPAPSLARRWSPGSVAQRVQGHPPADRKVASSRIAALDSV